MKRLWFRITQRLMVWSVTRAYYAAKAVGEEHEAQHILLAVAVSQSKHKNGKCIFDYTAANGLPTSSLALYYWEMNGMELEERTKP